MKCFLKKVKSQDSVWKHDLQNTELVDNEKIEFIYQSAIEYLKATIEVSTRLRESATKALGALLTAISAITGFLIVTRNDPHFIENIRFTLPAVILWGGYILAAGILLNCLWLRPFAFCGNEPKNLLMNEQLAYNFLQIKISSLVGLQQSIETNKKNNKIIGAALNWAYLLSGLTPVLAGVAGFVV